ncbi:MAG: NAD(P)-dependent oxidoreductase, partial [Victivallales bacterium]|nr:NAD(P)-dependent oxidoreductase [Victivallales bacterium]
LEKILSIPNAELIEMMTRLDGDIMILGIAGKMGVTMGRLAVNAIRAAGVEKKVFGVARFSNPEDREKLQSWGIETIACDLLDQEAVRKLPQVKNIVFMAGRKFGTEGSEAQTWAMNVLAPAYVAEHFRDSRIVAFSTGCVYPLVGVGTCGCTEDVPPSPVGEYSLSCLGRERIFQYYSDKFGTKLLLFRLNYSIDLRYGVLHDIARNIWEGRPVDNTVGYFNVIWQGDANSNALRSLELADCPASVLNVTGPEMASVEKTALMLGKLMDRDVSFKGEPGDLCYLNNSAKMCRCLGYPSVSLEQMIRWQADWIVNGGVSIGKPTHFEVNNGKF